MGNTECERILALRIMVAVLLCGLDHSCKPGNSAGLVVGITSGRVLQFVAESLGRHLRR